MEFLRFIFSSFWVWLGFVVLVAAAGGAVAEIVKAIRPARKIAVYRTGDVVRVEVEGAGRGDIPAAVKTIQTIGFRRVVRRAFCTFGRRRRVEYKPEFIFVRGRLRFTDEEGNAYAPAPFPSMVVIYNGKRR